MSTDNEKLILRLQYFFFDVETFRGETSFFIINVGKMDVEKNTHPLAKRGQRGNGENWFEGDKKMSWLKSRF